VKLRHSAVRKRKHLTAGDAVISSESGRQHYLESPVVVNRQPAGLLHGLWEYKCFSKNPAAGLFLCMDFSLKFGEVGNGDVLAVHGDEAFGLETAQVARNQLAHGADL